MPVRKIYPIIRSIFVVLLLAIFVWTFPLQAQNLFTRVNPGDLTNDGGISAGASWGDYDNDGDPDLFVANWANQSNALYRNNGDQSFTKMQIEPFVSDRGYSSGGCWGDYDNDDDLDLFVVNQQNQNNYLYRNNGDGSFQKVHEGDIVTDYGDSYTAAWADYDNDGFLDLFVANSNQPSFLYHNNGDGTFERIKESVLTSDVVVAWNASWGDYNNDGLVDLFVADSYNQKNCLYKNLGAGNFEKVTQGPVVNDIGYSKGGSWGDYDNDGDLDLFVANGGASLDGQNDFLYKNNGDGTFTKIEEGDVVNSEGYSHGGVWGDFDNDGDLDLFVGIWGYPDRLFFNNGDGTFTRQMTGAAVNQIGFVSGNVPVADYDNDGDLDLFLPNWENQNNILLRNNTGANNWIQIKCQGVKSNAYGIGAKVWINATIDGAEITQLREIKTNTGCRSQGGMNAHFGLGDADQIKSLRIIWPSNQEDIFETVQVNQNVTIKEGEGIVHREKPEAVVRRTPIFTVINQAISTDGLDAAILQYKKLKQENPDEYNFDENQLNYLGYRLMQEGKTDEAIQIFQVNKESFPESANACDSLAEAYLRNGNIPMARKLYKNVIKMLENNLNITGDTRDALLNGARYALKNMASIIQ